MLKTRMHICMHLNEDLFGYEWLVKMNTSRSKLETCQYLLPNPDFHLSWWMGVPLLGDLSGQIFTSLIGIRHAIYTGQMIASLYWSSKYHTPPSVTNLCKITQKNGGLLQYLGWSCLIISCLSCWRISMLPWEGNKIFSTVQLLSYIRIVARQAILMASVVMLYIPEFNQPRYLQSRYSYTAFHSYSFNKMWVPHGQIITRIAALRKWLPIGAFLDHYIISS